MVEWFRVTDTYGVVWPFYLVPTGDARLEGKAAITDTDKNCVFVENIGDKEKIKIIAFHEMVHINWSPPGGIAYLQAIFKTKTDEKTRDAEELMVSYQAPILYAFLTKNGFLFIPDIPDIKHE